MKILGANQVVVELQDVEDFLLRKRVMTGYISTDMHASTHARINSLVTRARGL